LSQLTRIPEYGQIIWGGLGELLILLSLDPQGSSFRVDSKLAGSCASCMRKSIVRSQNVGVLAPLSSSTTDSKLAFLLMAGSSAALQGEGRFEAAGCILETQRFCRTISTARAAFMKLGEVDERMKTEGRDSKDRKLLSIHFF
jgi:hypothetical protein